MKLSPLLSSHWELNTLESSFVLWWTDREARKFFLSKQISALVNDQLSISIGKLCIAFGRLEEAAVASIAEFFATSEYRKIELIASGLPLKKRLDALVSLAIAAGLPKSKIEAFRKIVGRAGKLAERRNEIVHSNWETTITRNGLAATKSVNRTRVKTSRKGANYHFAPPNIPEIDMLTADIRHTEVELLEATNDVCSYVERRRKKSELKS